MSETKAPNPNTTLRITPPIQFGIDLAKDIRRKVMPIYEVKQTGVTINEISKDFSYAIDQESELLITSAFRKAWKAGRMWGYVTEDQGMVLPPTGKADLI